MGFYLTPPENIECVGRKLKPFYTNLPAVLPLKPTLESMEDSILETVEPVRVLQQQKAAPDYFKLLDSLQLDEVLVGSYDRGFRKDSVYIIDSFEYKEMEELVKAGKVLRLGYFALKKNLAPKHWRVNG